MMVLVKMMMLIVMGAGHLDTLRMMLVVMMVVMMILRFLSELLVNKSASLISLSFCSSRIRFLAESIVVSVYKENRSPIPSQAGLRRLHTP